MNIIKNNSFRVILCMCLPFFGSKMFLKNKENPIKSTPYIQNDCITMGYWLVILSQFFCFDWSISLWWPIPILLHIQMKIGIIISHELLFLRYKISFYIKLNYYFLLLLIVILMFLFPNGIKLETMNWKKDTKSKYVSRSLCHYKLKIHFVYLTYIRKAGEQQADWCLPITNTFYFHFVISTFHIHSLKTSIYMKCN